MRKFPLPLLAILLFTACQKEITKENVSEKIGSVAAKGPNKKIDVCHKGHTISINLNAWPAHQAHGDLLGECLAILTTTICDQTWMVRNLDVSTYRNGDQIPQVTDPAAWAALTTGAWCYYFNDPANGPIYGKLYNWYAVNDPRGLAPAGWHVPSDVEWTTLSTCLGGEEIAGGKLKEAGTAHWFSPNIDATNTSGFTGLPGGIRYVNGSFASIGSFGYWWSSTVFNPSNAWFRFMHNNHGLIQRTIEFSYWGFSVRCVRD